MSIVVPFADYLGLETRESSLERGVVLLPARAELSNHIGSQHAGALFTAAEAASGAALIGRFGTELAAGAVPLVSRADIEYQRVARGPIVATAIVEQAREAVLEQLRSGGKASFKVTVTLTDEAGTTVATTVVQWHLRAPRPAA
jgi:acyl-coenzyme A thioesterase PaaI-like protein